MGQAVGLLGTAVSAAGTIAGGAAANQAAQAQAAGLEFQALQYKQNAGTARGVGQRSADEKRLEGRLAQSTLQARAAAGGGSATDPTAIKLASDIGGRSEYMALTEGYKGEDKARGYEDAAAGALFSAAAARAGGQAAQTGAMIGAAGSLLSGIGSAYSNYKGVAPAAVPTVAPAPSFLDPNKRYPYTVG